jgi:hypothetical protein
VALTSYVPTLALVTVHVACAVLVPAMLLTDELAQLGLPGLWLKAHPTLPVGDGVVLFGGITVAVKVRVEPRMGGLGDPVAATRTVVVAACRTTKLKVPEAPLGPWTKAVSCWAPLLGHVLELAATQPELGGWAFHCCTGLTEME